MRTQSFTLDATHNGSTHLSNSSQPRSTILQNLNEKTTLHTRKRKGDVFFRLRIAAIPANDCVCVCECVNECAVVRKNVPSNRRKVHKFFVHCTENMCTWLDTDLALLLFARVNIDRATAITKRLPVEGAGAKRRASHPPARSARKVHAGSTLLARLPAGRRSPGISPAINSEPRARKIKGI